MKPFISPFLGQLKPYVPGEQPQSDDVIKLNTNENPYPPSPAVQKAVQSVPTEVYRKYPDPDCRELRLAIADFYGIDAGNVFVGNGSDEVLALSFLAFFKREEPILFADISYSFYAVYCDLFQIHNRRIPLTPELDIDLEGYAGPSGGVILANPNAVTGKTVALADISGLLQRQTRRVVVVDEAYVDFGAESSVALTRRFPNLLVVQTCSKSRSLAGLRVGLAIGARPLIDVLMRVKNSFNSYPLDRLAITAGAAAFRDRPYFEASCKRIEETRGFVSERMSALDFEVVPSRANFLLVRHRRLAAVDLFHRLKRKNIYVRHFDTPRLKSYLRVSIGTQKEMLVFLESLEQML